MIKQETISTIQKFVKGKMEGEGTGHDWYHIERVVATAKRISKKEKNADKFLVEAAALLHDIGDWKLNSSGRTEEEILRSVCKKLALEDSDSKKIIEIIINMSFSANIGRRKDLCLEGKIVQDADRLDALGAIGIARAFAYGGKKGRELYNPSKKPKKFSSTHSYRNSDGPTVNHFYEKLFSIKKQLNTKKAVKIATKREAFMKEFLKEFYAEWDGKR